MAFRIALEFNVKITLFGHKMAACLNKQHKNAKFLVQ